MNSKKQCNECVVYELNLPVEGTFYEFFHLDSVEAQGGIEKLEEFLMEECNWFRQLGYISEQDHGGTHSVPIADITKLAANAKSPVRIGRKHPCFNASPREMEMYDAVTKVIKRVIADSKSEKNGTRYSHALKNVRLTAEEISQMVRQLDDGKTVEYRIESDVVRFESAPDGRIYEQNVVGEVIVKISEEKSGGTGMLRVEAVPQPHDLDASFVQKVGAA